jgi:4-hydroxybenzoyl-CoA reductase subunit beta
MMRANAFRYLAPRTLAEAASMLAAEGPAARLLAGGTDLVPNMKRRQQTPPVVVSLRRIPTLRAIAAAADGSLAIGASVTLTELALEPRLGEARRAAARAAGSVATPQIRNMGTVGGNLCLDTRCNYYDQSYEWRKAIDFCMKAPKGEAQRTRDGGICWVATQSPRCWAVSSTDTAPALVALGAEVSLVSAGGERRIPLGGLYVDDGMDYLTKRPDEILTAVHVPALDGWRSTYWKLRRRGAFDFPVLGVAAAVKLGAAGVVEQARLVLGAVASHPVTVDTASLVGRPLDDAAIEAFADAASKHAKPLDNTDFALGWRKRVARAYVVGALRELRGDDVSVLGPLARHATAMLPLATVG